ncbi:unnamed protein product, partial [Dovyalis caffra]
MKIGRTRKETSQKELPDGSKAVRRWDCQDSDHRRFGQHKKNRRIEFLVKWAKNGELSWEKDTDLWQFEEK